MRHSTTHSLAGLPLLICCFLAICPGLGCWKTCDSPIGGYLFVLPHQVSPVKEVYNVGDTITVTADFSHYVKESRGAEYRLEDFKFGLSFSLIDLLDTNVITAIYGFSSCEIIIDTFSNLILGGIGPKGEYSYDNIKYSLLFKFQVLRPGFFALTQKSLASQGTRGLQRDFEGKCCKSDFVAAFVEVNERAENNYHLLSNDHVTAYTHDWISIKEEFYQNGVFVFLVEE